MRAPKLALLSLSTPGKKSVSSKRSILRMLVRTCKFTGNDLANLATVNCTLHPSDLKMAGFR
jgi:hypothetical protein